MVDVTTGRVRPSATTFVLLTIAFSWSIWISAWFVTGRPTATTTSAGMATAVYLGSFAPGVVAAILSALSPRGSFKAWLRTFFRFRCGWRAYAAALLPLPLTLLLLTLLLDYTPRLEALHGKPAVMLYLTIFPAAIANGLVTAIIGTGPLGEEGGWRGYLLPRLLERGGEARASVIIGIIWALWHLPIMAMFSDWRAGAPFLTYLPIYTLGVVGLSFVMSRVWLIGNASLVPCIWLHGLVNAVGGVAFDHRVWTSPWSAEASSGHFAIAMVCNAGFLLLTMRHRQSGTAVSKGVARAG